MMVAILFLIGMHNFMIKYLQLVSIGVTEKEYMSRRETAHTFNIYDKVKNELTKE